MAKQNYKTGTRQAMAMYVYARGQFLVGLFIFHACVTACSEIRNSATSTINLWPMIKFSKAYYFARNVSEHSTTTWGKGVFRPKAPQMRLSWVKKHKTLFEFGCWRRTPHLNIVSWTCVVWLVVGGHLISFDMADDTWTISVFALGEAIETSAHQKHFLAAGLVPCDQL